MEWFFTRVWRRMRTHGRRERVDNEIAELAFANIGT
jgi:hypothetical protein